jgi:hypothetical protein
MPNGAVALMGQFWDASEQGGRYVGVLEKFQMALLFAGKPKLEAGAYPYQDAKLLISIRNDLVHFRPVTQTHGEEMAREKQLKGQVCGKCSYARRWQSVVPG